MTNPISHSWTVGRHDAPGVFNDPFPVDLTTTDEGMQYMLFGPTGETWPLSAARELRDVLNALLQEADR